METPVVAADGYTYEKAAIEEWFRSQGRPARSPMTNLPLRDIVLLPNRALAAAIRAYREHAEGMERKTHDAVATRENLEKAVRVFIEEREGKEEGRERELAQVKRENSELRSENSELRSEMERLRKTVSNTAKLFLEMGTALSTNGSLPASFVGAPRVTEEANSSTPGGAAGATPGPAVCSYSPPLARLTPSWVSVALLPLPSVAFGSTSASSSSSSSPPELALDAGQQGAGAGGSGSEARVVLTPIQGYNPENSFNSNQQLLKINEDLKQRK